MAKSIPSSGAGAVRIILKNKENFHFSLRNKGQEGDRTSYLYDVNATGTLNMMVKDGVVEIAALNLSLGKVITLDSDTNLKKLCTFVLESEK